MNKWKIEEKREREKQKETINQDQKMISQTLTLNWTQQKALDIESTQSYFA